MFRPVTAKPDFVAQEHELLAEWAERRTFARLRAQNEGGPRWSFLDGPITANNPMGVHHAWGRAYKDLYQRFHAMRGEDQRYQNGFDCQGLWVEAVLVPLVLAAHRVEALVEVLVRASPRVVDAHRVVRGDRPVEEAPPRAALVLRSEARERAALRP